MNENYIKYQIESMVAKQLYDKNIFSKKVYDSIESYLFKEIKKLNKGEKL